MLMATVTERQREAYLAPYVRGETISAIGISEPGAGGDPAGMTTRRAERDGEDWVINGRKIWISRAAERRLHHPDGGHRQGESARAAASPPSWSTRARPASTCCGAFR
jgi:alkylation response protein AidB-like acyl-CoA dehydrogenase